MKEVVVIKKVGVRQVGNGEEGCIYGDTQGNFHFLVTFTQPFFLPVALLPCNVVISVHYIWNTKSIELLIGHQQKLNVKILERLLRVICLCLRWQNLQEAFVRRRVTWEFSLWYQLCCVWDASDLHASGQVSRRWGRFTWSKVEYLDLRVMTSSRWALNSLREAWGKPQDSHWPSHRVHGQADVQANRQAHPFWSWVIILNINTSVSSTFIHNLFYTQASAGTKLGSED